MPEIVHALRTLVRKPRFTLLVVVTLGLGIGAATAIFSVTCRSWSLRPGPNPCRRSSASTPAAAT